MLVFEKKNESSRAVKNRWLKSVVREYTDESITLWVEAVAFSESQHATGDGATEGLQNDMAESKMIHKSHISWTAKRRGS